MIILLVTLGPFEQIDASRTRTLQKNNLAKINNPYQTGGPSGQRLPVQRSAFSNAAGPYSSVPTVAAFLGQHRTIPTLRLKHRSGSCGTASALPKCSIVSGCDTRIVLRGQKPLALCDRCLCFGSLFPPLAALTFAASSIICAFGLAAAAPRSPYRHLELCGIALNF